MENPNRVVVKPEFSGGGQRPCALCQEDGIAGLRDRRIGKVYSAPHAGASSS